MAGSFHSTPCRSGGGARFEEAGYAVSALQAPYIGFGGLSEYRFTLICMDIWINLFVNQRYLLNDGTDVGPRADWKTGSPQCGNIYYCS